MSATGICPEIIESRVGILLMAGLKNGTVIFIFQGSVVSSTNANLVQV